MARIDNIDEEGRVTVKFNTPIFPLTNISLIDEKAMRL